MADLPMTAAADGADGDGDGAAEALTRGMGSLGLTQHPPEGREASSSEDASSAKRSRSQFEGAREVTSCGEAAAPAGGSPLGAADACGGVGFGGMGQCKE